MLKGFEVNSKRFDFVSAKPLGIATVVFLLSGLQLNAQTQSIEHSKEEEHSVSVVDLKKNWIGFRGFHSNGQATDASPPLIWSVKNNRNVLWKVPIAKHGMSSPIVWKDRVFLTGANDESRDVYCFDSAKGKLLWTHEVSDLPDSPAKAELPRVLAETGYAAPTMATNGHQVAAIFASGELVCLDMHGKRAWAKHLGVPNNHYGHASSLICNRELLFVQVDQKENSKLHAFKMATGRPAWQVDRDEMSWASPILVDNKGRTELLLTDNKSVSSYDPKSGKRFWRIECLNGEVACSPAYANGIVFVANEGARATAIDIRDYNKPKILWQWDGDLPDTSSLVANEKYLILPTAFGVVSCLDANRGIVLWEHEFDRGFSSSPVLLNDRVCIIDLSGNMQTFRFDKKFKLVGQSDIGEHAYATPAFVGDKIYIRGLNHLFCIGEE